MFCESMFQLVSGKKTAFEFSVPKTKRTIQTFISERYKANFCGMGVHQCKRHECKGTTGVDAYIKFVQRHIQPSR